MSEHPCQRHRPGQHIDACRTGLCGFCGADLSAAGCGECRGCLLMVCERCDGRFQPDLGPICGPCTPPQRPGPAGAELQTFRLCVFDLALSCGHMATVALTGWYPVSVACCDRLGGTVLRGDYVPYASDVDYVNILSERYEDRTKGTPCARTRVIGRRPRTDDPYVGAHPSFNNAGRYPARVGATSSRDGSAPATTPR